MTRNFDIWLKEQSGERAMLLVDDSAADTTLICNFSSRYMIRWIVARNEAEAILEIEFEMPRLVFLDLNLGGGGSDGVIAFQHLKTRWPKLPIVILSGHMSESSYNQITKVGVTLFAAKPSEWNESYFDALFDIMNIPLRPAQKPVDEVAVMI